MILCMTSTNETKLSTEANKLEDCILRISQNDREAFTTLYNEIRASVYGFALSVLKNCHDAEDILHDCYLSVISSACSYRPCGKPMAWILTITRNLCLMKLREYRRMGELPDEDWEKYLSEKESVSPEDRLIISECMLTLSDTERQIVVLHAVAGFKHREIAGILGLPLPTVLSKHSRALKKLKARLTKEDHFVNDFPSAHFVTSAPPAAHINAQSASPAQERNDHKDGNQESQ